MSQMSQKSQMPFAVLVLLLCIQSGFGASTPQTGAKRMARKVQTTSQVQGDGKVINRVANSNSMVRKRVVQDNMVVDADAMMQPMSMVQLGDSEEAAQCTNKVTIKSTLDGKCVIFSGNGNDKNPSRHDWGSGNEYCGFPGGQSALLGNKQGVFNLQKLEGDKYIIKSALDNKCMIFSGNGNDKHPSRHDWGSGNEFCGFPGGMSKLLENKQAVFQLVHLEGDKYIIKSALDNKCVIFSGNGNDKHPSRHDWGSGNEFCGFPGGKSKLLENKQAVFVITGITSSFCDKPTHGNCRQNGVHGGYCQILNYEGTEAECEAAMLSTTWAVAAEYGVGPQGRKDCSLLQLAKAAPPSCPEGFGSPKHGNGDVTAYAGDGSVDTLTCMQIDTSFDGVGTGDTSTCGGDADGAACTFPFTYNGKQYDQCTKDDHSEPWCMTTTPGKWGNCDCPKESQVESCGGDSDDGAHCVFPFMYEGVQHRQCTMQGHNRPWCYTTTVGELTDGQTGRKWGNCDCATTTTTTTTSTTEQVKPHDASASGQCSSAADTVTTVTTDIKTEVIPKLEKIAFETALSDRITKAKAANTSAWTVRTTADSNSVELDECRAKESECQQTVITLETEHVTITEETTEECDEQKRLAKYEFGMPSSTHGGMVCDFAAHSAGTSRPTACWDSAYLSALQQIEAEVEEAEQLWVAKKQSCTQTIQRKEEKTVEITEMKADCSAQRAKCNKVKERKDASYCNLEGKIANLCEATSELKQVWAMLEAQKSKKRAAIRTMKITSCMYSEHYSLGNAACEGCQLASLSPCEHEYPATADYGVDSTPPTAVEAIPGLFGLPPSTEAATAWCKPAELGNAAVITFPGHLWTRAPDGMLSRESGPESTTVAKICI